MNHGQAASLVPGNVVTRIGDLPIHPPMRVKHVVDLGDSLCVSGHERIVFTNLTAEVVFADDYVR